MSKEWIKLGTWVSVASDGNITVSVTNEGTSTATAHVSNISAGNVLWFKAYRPLATENWFEWAEADKNIYFDNKVHVNDYDPSNAYECSIKFDEAPTKSNTDNTNPISTRFHVINVHGEVDDPILEISY